MRIKEFILLCTIVMATSLCFGIVSTDNVETGGGYKYMHDDTEIIADRLDSASCNIALASGTSNTSSARTFTRNNSRKGKHLQRMVRGMIPERLRSILNTPTQTLHIIHNNTSHLYTRCIYIFDGVLII